MGKSIVIISNYYPPEMGAAANRIKNLAEGLTEKGNDVTIICPLPNYPIGKIFEKYKNKFTVNESIEGIKVKRFWIYPSKSEKAIVRLFSMLSFAWSFWFSIFSFIRKKPDLFIIQSPPLLVALSGLLFSKLLGCKNVLNVSDIWPLSALELGVIKKGFFYSFLEKIEKVNYKLADKIIGQSEEIITHIKAVVDKDFLVYRNVPNIKKYSVKEKSEGNLKIVYAGLLGYAQGILNICNEINFKEIGSELHIYGAGMEEEKIIEFAANPNNNVFFYGVRTAKEIKEEIRKYDIGFVPLKNKIYGAVPSKIFELMQLGVPILYVGSGEAEEILGSYKSGLYSEPGDLKSLIKNISIFKEMNNTDYRVCSNNNKSAHLNEFNLEKQMDKLQDFIN
ncbi:glycosyltransferase family 4 protein [Polaribacter sp. Z014]|uniref:glycosyltransferase family 4 protein n=1 Tax=Polaribacter sp. Z014 TaxID=2927126 RepID=UPI0020227090|nr:glycosyltransferase family 4 protein [Polaribacter sp. Z014]MCL7764223.1 glycosyltransferase family 4 protein [Polaribacter sp. Z014]